MIYIDVEFLGEPTDFGSFKYIRLVDVISNETSQEVVQKTKEEFRSFTALDALDFTVKRKL